MTTKISGSGFDELIIDNLILSSPLAEQYGGTGSTGAYKMGMATAVATTSGTAIDFTGIPSWAKRITVMFNGVSTNGASPPQIQLGDSGGVEITGYLSGSRDTTVVTAGGGVGSTSGFVLGSAAPVNLVYGTMTLTLFDTTSWISSHAMYFKQTDHYAIVGGGSKTLSATLDRLRLTTVNGTDTFDAGSVNIMWEGV